MALGRPFTLVGSRNRAHLHLVSSTISKTHAAIIHDNGRVYVRDLASRTHVYANGRVIREMELADGDLLQFGSFTFKLSHPRRAENVPTPPPAQLEMNGSAEAMQLDGRTTTIGRRPQCDLFLDDEAVSTVHAIIFELDGQRFIRDLGSRTGTFVNGTAVHQQPLNFGDRVRIGPMEYRYQPSQLDAGTFADMSELEDLVGTAPLVQTDADAVTTADFAADFSDATTPTIALASAEPPADQAADLTVDDVAGDDTLEPTPPETIDLEADLAEGLADTVGLPPAAATPVEPPSLSPLVDDYTPEQPAAEGESTLAASDLPAFDPDDLGMSANMVGLVPIDSRSADHLQAQPPAEPEQPSEALPADTNNFAPVDELPLDELEAEELPPVETAADLAPSNATGSDDLRADTRETIDVFAPADEPTPYGEPVESVQPANEAEAPAADPEQIGSGLDFLNEPIEAGADEPTPATSDTPTVAMPAGAVTSDTPTLEMPVPAVAPLPPSGAPTHTPAATPASEPAAPAKKSFWGRLFGRGKGDAAAGVAAAGAAAASAATTRPPAMPEAAAGDDLPPIDVAATPAANELQLPPLDLPADSELPGDTALSELEPVSGEAVPAPAQDAGHPGTDAAIDDALELPANDELPPTGEAAGELDFAPDLGTDAVADNTADPVAVPAVAGQELPDGFFDDLMADDATPSTDSPAPAAETMTASAESALPVEGESTLSIDPSDALMPEPSSADFAAADLPAATETVESPASQAAAESALTAPEAPAAPEVTQTPAAPAALDPLFGLGRDLGSFIGGMPLPLGPVPGAAPADRAAPAAEPPMLPGGLGGGGLAPPPSMRGPVNPPRDAQPAQNTPTQNVPPRNAPRGPASAGRPAPRGRLPFADAPVTFDTPIQTLAEVVAVENEEVPVFGAPPPRGTAANAPLQPMRSDLMPPSADDELGLPFGGTPATPAASAESLPTSAEIPASLPPASAQPMPPAENALDLETPQFEVPPDTAGELSSTDRSAAEQPVAELPPEPSFHFPVMPNLTPAGALVPPMLSGVASTLDAPAMPAELPGVGAHDPHFGDAGAGGQPAGFAPADVSAETTVDFSTETPELSATASDAAELTPAEEEPLELPADALLPDEEPATIDLTPETSAAEVDPAASHDIDDLPLAIDDLEVLPEPAEALAFESPAPESPAAEAGLSAFPADSDAPSIDDFLTPGEIAEAGALPPLELDPSAPSADAFAPAATEDAVDTAAHANAADATATNFTAGGDVAAAAAPGDVDLDALFAEPLDDLPPVNLPEGSTDTTTEPPAIELFVPEVVGETPAAADLNELPDDLFDEPLEATAVGEDVTVADANATPDAATPFETETPIEPGVGSFDAPAAPSDIAASIDAGAPVEPAAVVETPAEFAVFEQPSIDLPTDSTADSAESVALEGQLVTDTPEPIDLFDEPASEVGETAPADAAATDTASTDAGPTDATPLEASPVAMDLFDPESTAVVPQLAPGDDSPAGLTSDLAASPYADPTYSQAAYTEPTPAPAASDAARDDAADDAATSAPTDRPPTQTPEAAEVIQPIDGIEAVEPVQSAEGTEPPHSDLAAEPLAAVDMPLVIESADEASPATPFAVAVESAELPSIEDFAAPAASEAPESLPTEATPASDVFVAQPAEAAAPVETPTESVPHVGDWAIEAIQHTPSEQAVQGESTLPTAEAIGIEAAPATTSTWPEADVAVQPFDAGQAFPADADAPAIAPIEPASTEPATIDSPWQEPAHAEASPYESSASAPALEEPTVAEQPTFDAPTTETPIAESMPIDVTPIDIAPIESAAAETTAAELARPEIVTVDVSAPDVMPAEVVPVESADSEVAPVEAAAVEVDAVEAAPVEIAPEEPAPVADATIDTAPAEVTPSEDIAADFAPAESDNFGSAAVEATTDAPVEAPAETAFSADFAVPASDSTAEWTPIPEPLATADNAAYDAPSAEVPAEATLTTPDLTTPDPTTSDSAASEPTPADPIAIEPIAIEPIGVEPVPGEPIVSDPASVETASIETALIETPAVEVAAEPATLDVAPIEVSASEAPVEIEVAPAVAEPAEPVSIDVPAVADETPAVSEIATPPDTDIAAATLGEPVTLDETVSIDEPIATEEPIAPVEPTAEGNSSSEADPSAIATFDPAALPADDATASFAPPVEWQDADPATSAEPAAESTNLEPVAETTTTPDTTSDVFDPISAEPVEAPPAFDELPVVAPTAETTFTPDAAAETTPAADLSPAAGIAPAAELTPAAETPLTQVPHAETPLPPAVEPNQGVATGLAAGAAVAGGAVARATSSRRRPTAEEPPAAAVPADPFGGLPQNAGEESTPLADVFGGGVAPVIPPSRPAKPGVKKVVRPSARKPSAPKPAIAAPTPGDGTTAPLAKKLSTPPAGRRAIAVKRPGLVSGEGFRPPVVGVPASRAPAATPPAVTPPAAPLPAADASRPATPAPKRPAAAQPPVATAPARPVAKKPARVPAAPAETARPSAAGKGLLDQLVEATPSTDDASPPVFDEAAPVDPFTNTGGGPPTEVEAAAVVEAVQRPPGSRRRVVRIVLIVIAVTLAAAAIGGVWMFVKSRSSASAGMKFVGLSPQSIAGQAMSDYQLRQRQILESREALELARADVAAAGFTPGLLGDDTAQARRRADVLAAAQWKIADPGDTSLSLTLTADPADAPADGDRARLLALLKATRQLSLAAVRPAASVESAPAYAEAQRLRASREKLIADRSAAEAILPDAPVRRTRAVAARVEADKLNQELVRATAEADVIKAEIARLEKRPPSTQSVAATQPDTTDAPDAQLTQINADLARTQSELSAAATARDTRIAAAKGALDEAQKQFDTVISKAKEAAGGDAAVAAYVEIVQGLAAQVRQLNDDLVQQQKDRRQQIEDQRRLLAAASAERIRAAWEADPTLKDLMKRRGIAERQYNAAVSEERSEAESYRLQLAALDRQVNAQRDLIATRDEFDPAAKQMLKLLDDLQQQLEQDRRRTDTRMAELSAAAAKARPDPQKLSGEQQARAQRVEEANRTLESARRSYERAVEQATVQADEQVRQLSGQAAQLQARAEARRRELAAIAASAPETLEERRKALATAEGKLADITRVAAAANNDLKRLEAEAADADAASGRILRLSSELQQIDRLIAENEEKARQWANNPLDLVRLAEPTGVVLQGKDPRLAYSGLAMAGGVFLVLMALAATRTPVARPARPAPRPARTATAPITVPAVDAFTGQPVSPAGAIPPVRKSPGPRRTVA